MDDKCMICGGPIVLGDFTDWDRVEAANICTKCADAMMSDDDEQDGGERARQGRECTASRMSSPVPSLTVLATSVHWMDLQFDGLSRPNRRPHP